MKLFDVYPRFKVTLEKAYGVYLWDDQHRQYLDFYGGHGVISIGHSHPGYIKRVNQQLDKLVFYSNSIYLPIQDELAQKLSEASGYHDYQLFLCNSGAEANENALKLASFYTGKRKVIAFKGSFHGRTAAALNVTDNLKLSAPLNFNNFPVKYLELNKEKPLKDALRSDDVCAIIVEGIQGVGGLDAPSVAFLKFLSQQSKQHGIILILDEIQSGYGRSGKFFAHQYADIKPDIITIAKGMGNGFPIGGVLISPEIKAEYGLLGTTFGGNPLACAAGIAVLDVMKRESVVAHVNEIGGYLKKKLQQLPKVKQIKGKGLMLGVEFDFPIKGIREKLVYDYHIFTGSSANPNLLRILPPLIITRENADTFVKALTGVLS